LLSTVLMLASCASSGRAEASLNAWAIFSCNVPGLHPGAAWSGNPPFSCRWYHQPVDLQPDQDAVLFVDYGAASCPAVLPVWNRRSIGFNGIGFTVPRRNLNIKIRHRAAVGAVASVTAYIQQFSIPISQSQVVVALPADQPVRYLLQHDIVHRPALASTTSLSALFAAATVLLPRASPKARHAFTGARAAMTPAPAS